MILTQSEIQKLGQKINDMDTPEVRVISIPRDGIDIVFRRFEDDNSCGKHILREPKNKLSKQFIDFELSKATLLQEDLIPAFFNFLINEDFEHLIREEEIAYDLLSRQEIEQSELTGIYINWKEYYDSEDASEDLDILFRLLNDIAPDGCCFSAHEGDASSFGFWKILDEDI